MNPIELAEALKKDRPDFEELYGPGTSGEIIAHRTWEQAMSVFIARYKKEEKSPQPHPHVISEDR